MALLTPELLEEIRDIVAKHHNAVVAGVFGDDAVSQAVLEKLKNAGLIPQSAQGIEDAYLYGHVAAILEDPKVPKWPIEKLRAYVKENPVPLTTAEKAAVQSAKLSASQYVKGLGNVVAKDTMQVLINADKALAQKLGDDINNTVAVGIEARKTVKAIKSDLGKATGDWTRNLDRIVVTEKHNAMQVGVADQIGKKHGSDARVVIIPMPDACQHCKRLHLGPDGHPRIFKLSQLAPPGANIGKKPIDWVPSLGAVHPYCQCQLAYLPHGWGFDETGDMVPGGEFGVEYEGSLTKALLLEEDRADFLEKSYKLAGRTKWHGMHVSIEQNKGDHRFWKDRNGEEGKTLMRYAYGYLRQTEGVDGDHVDVYLGPDPSADHVYVVHQRIKGKNGFHGYDEDKCMLDFPSAAAAKQAYIKQYNDPGFFGGMSKIPVETFLEQVKATKDKPAKLTGELIEKGGEKLVLLEKAELPNQADLDPKLHPAIGGATVEQDMGHMRGTGVNIQGGSPEMYQGERQHVAGEKFFLKQPEPREIVIRRDPKMYEALVGLEHIYPLAIGDGQYAEAASADNRAEEHKEELERTLLQDNDVPRNTTVNPGWNPGQREHAALWPEQQEGPEAVEIPLRRTTKRPKRTAVAKSVLVPKDVLE